MGKRSSANRQLSFALREPQPLVAWFCQRASFLVLVLVLAVSPLALGAVQPWAMGCIVGAVGLALALWIVRILTEPELRLVLSPIGLPLMVGAAYALVRYALAGIEPIGRPDMIMGITVVAFFYLLVNNIRHRWQLSVLMWMWVAVGSFVSLQGLLQILGEDQRIWHLAQPLEFVGRASGPFLDPNHFAAYLAAVFPLAAANFLFSRRSFAEKIMLGIAGLLMGAGLLLSQSVCGWFAWLGSGVVGVMYLVRARGKKFRWAMVGIGALGAVVLAAVIVLFLSQERAGSSLPDSPQRVLPLWRTALLIARRSPMIGAGGGMFQWLHPMRRFTQGHAEYAHNEYLNVLAEYGLVGAAIGTWLIVAFFVGGSRILARRAARYSASTPSNRYAFAVGGMAGFVAILLLAIFDYPLHIPGLLFTLAGMMAAVMNCGLRQHGTGDEEGDRNAGLYTPMRVPALTRWVLAAALAAGVVCVTPSWTRTFASEFYLWRGDHAKEQLDWAAAEQNYERARGFDKRNFRAAIAAGDLYAVRATWNPARREQLSEQALDAYRAALNINSYAADVHIKMGRLYDLLDKRKQATERFEQAVHADPFNAVYHVQLGLHHQRWGDAEAALASFEEAKSLGGSDPVIALEVERLPADLPEEPDM